MDGEVEQMNGDAVATEVPTRTALIAGDSVMFKTKGTHGDCGMVRDPQLDKLPDGFVGVLCVDGAVVHAVESDLTVVDRGYLCARQFVVSASDPGGQIGVIVETTTSLDLAQLGTSDNDGEPVPVARGVSPADVRRVRELSIGDYVVYGAWLGKVLEVSLDVDVRFYDGAVCRVADADGKLGVAAHGIFRPDMNSEYYPGLRVSPTADNLSIFESSRWLTGVWLPTHLAGTVVRVEMATVRVDWVASATLGTQRDIVEASAPPAYQPNPHVLTRCGSVAGWDWGWGVGDRCFFRRRTTSE
ncbi:hypothetical protein EJB05_33648, partial [Eragrostis curvula]